MLVCLKVGSGDFCFVFCVLIKWGLIWEMILMELLRSVNLPRIFGCC